MATKKSAATAATTKTAAARAALARAPHTATGQLVELYGHKTAQLLYAKFREYNAQFFGGALGTPLVLITQAQSARTLGDYVARDLHGLESRIRISPKAVKRGELFACDVLLHEMIHAWAAEVAKDGEDSYRGHGPRFAAECTRIGALLGLPPVGVKGRDGLPDCKGWPMAVRPEGYYPEAYEAPKRKSKPEAGGGGGEGDGEGDEREPNDDDDSGPEQNVVRQVCKLLGALSRRDLRLLAVAVELEIDQRAQAEGEEQDAAAE